MAYLHIDPATKIAAVKDYWQTGNLKKCAEKYGVSRNGIYDWVRLVEQHLEEIFQASTPGKRTASLAEQNQKLQSQLDEVLDDYHKLSQSRTPLSPELARCPQCQTTSLRRNGRVRTKRAGIQQRLWCRRCNVSLYADIKKTL
jgi:transposase-like protein